MFGQRLRIFTGVFTNIWTRNNIWTALVFGLAVAVLGLALLYGPVAKQAALIEYYLDKD